MGAEPRGHPDPRRSRALAGVIPAPSDRAPISGAPLPLLRTDQGTFLERALGTLREAGADPILVLSDSEGGPVAAEARRHGGQVVTLGQARGGDPPSSGKRAAPGRVEWGMAHFLATAAREAPGIPLLLLPPAFALVRPETVGALVAAAGAVLASGAPGGGADDGHAGATADGPTGSPRLLVPVPPEGAGAQAPPWWARAPLLFLPTPGEGRPPEEDVDPGIPPWLAGGDPPADALVPVPVTDPGVVIQVDSLALYRRHFPGVYRKRFQKW